MVADRVPVLARPVVAERLGARVERDRVDVREVAAAARGRGRSLSNRLIVMSMSSQDPRVAGDAVGLGRAGQRVDLLVGRDRVVVVAELGGEDLALAGSRLRCRSAWTSSTMPSRSSVDSIPQVLAQVLGALARPPRGSGPRRSAGRRWRSRRRAARSCRSPGGGAADLGALERRSGCGTCGSRSRRRGTGPCR